MSEKRRKRHVSQQERALRSVRMKQWWKDRRKVLKEQGGVEEPKPKTTRVRGDVKYGHTKALRKDNIDITLEYKPWPHQYKLSQALDAGRRYIAFVAGIRSGKSFAGARECLRQIYGTKKGKGLGWIVAPTYGMSVVAERAFEAAAGAQLILKKRRTEREYLLRPAKAGDVPYLVQIKTAEHPDRLRGAEVDWVWWDEAAMCSEEVFDILMGRVLTTRGKIWMTTTPQGMTHWLYNEVVKRAEAGEKDYAYIKAATADNLSISDEDIKRLKEKYSDEFGAQELEGEFVNFTGLIYKDFSLSRDIFELSSATDMPILGGIDWGYNDPFVFLWVGEKDGHYYVLDEYYRSGEIPRIHLDVIRNNVHTSRINRIYSDVSRPESRREFSEGLGLSVLPGRTEKNDLIPGIEYVASLFKQGRIHVASHCRHLINELGKYCWRKKRDVNSGDVPMDTHNHCLDALRYVLYSERNYGSAKVAFPLGRSRKMVSTIERQAMNKMPKVVRRILKEAKSKKRRGWLAG